MNAEWRETRYNYSFLCINFRLEPNPEYWEGKRGACVGTFYSIITGRTIATPPNGFIDICTLLRESTNPQVEAVIRTIRNFSNDMS